MGDVGSGKTYLAKIICNNIDKDVKFNSAFELYSDYLFLLDSDFTDKSKEIKRIKQSLRGKFVILEI